MLRSQQTRVDLNITKTRRREAGTGRIERGEGRRKERKGKKEGDMEEGRRKERKQERKQKGKKE